VFGKERAFRGQSKPPDEMKTLLNRPMTHPEPKVPKRLKAAASARVKRTKEQVDLKERVWKK